MTGRKFTKECKSCGLQRSIDLYHKHPTTHDRLQTRCKICCREQGKAYYKKNKEAIRLKAMKKAAKPTRTKHQKAIVAFSESGVWWEGAEIYALSNGVSTFHFLNSRVHIALGPNEIVENSISDLSRLLTARYKKAVAEKKEKEQNA